MAPPSSMVAEYAKSNRSSCKACSKTIDSKALRLGLVTKDPRGFDAVKWHHLACFPLSSHSLSSPEHAIEGFSSLKSSDQEALKKLLVAGHDKFKEKDDKGTDDIENELPETEASDSMKRKFDKATDDIENELLETEASDSKNRKMAPPSSMVAEYAKSSRSSCKVCSKTIESKALRLGLVTKDPRGFDATKWHHLTCFPLPSHSHSSPEHAIKGFSSLKCSDQEALKKLLVAGHDKFQEKDDKGTDDIENELPETEASDSMKRKVDKATDDIENELLETEASDSKNRKMAPPSSMVAEYAKSSRSSCKVCSKRIESKALRLGLVTKDPRGFDATKWHHLACFPLPSHSHSSPEHAIKGFSSLKCSDQDALKKVLVAGNDKFQEKLCAYDVEPIVGVNFSVSDVKSKYKDAALLPKWKAFQTVIFLERDDGLHDSSKIAAFDFDGCLAKTDVKRVGPDLWSLMYPSIPDKLQSLYNDGFKLVIFTNESNIERWKYKRQVAVDSKIGRLNNFIDKVKVPIQVFIACGLGKSGKAEREKDDPFRKPQPGMWQLMEQHFNSSIAIDMDQSFYVGDAAGRESDHSDADIEFAKAIGLKFYVPEDYFGA